MAMPPRSSSRADVQRFFPERAAELAGLVPEDAPKSQRAVERLRAPSGGVVLDAGCGSGRAISVLREAVGPHGCVIGLGPDVADALRGSAQRTWQSRPAWSARPSEPPLSPPLASFLAACGPSRLRTFFPPSKGRGDG